MNYRGARQLSGQVCSSANRSNTFSWGFFVSYDVFFFNISEKLKESCDRKADNMNIPSNKGEFSVL